MVNNQVSSGQAILATKENNLTTGDTAPTTPAEGDLWSDTTGIGTPQLKVWDGTAWQSIVVGTLLIPTGLIAMWSGTLATIPAGWALCDGVGGRPNLRDKFVRGAAVGAGGGATGGADTASHNTAGEHTHDLLLGHTHAGTGTNVSVATHSAGGQHGSHGVPTAAIGVQGGASFAAGQTHEHDDLLGSHDHVNHSETINIRSDGGHQHTSDGTGHGSAHGTHDNKPAYYAVLFIIKT